jgi:YVTN family beta-propeller protein
MKSDLSRWLVLLTLALAATLVHPPSTAEANGIGSVYVGSTGTNTISVIDTNTNSVVEVISTSQPPTNLVFSPDARYVYASHSESNMVSLVDTGVEDVTATMKIGSQVAGIAVSSAGAWLVVTDPLEGKLRVIDTSARTELFSVPVVQAESLAALADGSAAYVESPTTGIVSTVDLRKRLVSGTVDAGEGNHYIAASPTGQQVAVASSKGANLLILDAVTGRVVRTVAAGQASGAPAFSPTGDLVYVPRASSNDMAIVSLGSGSVTGTIPLSGHPSAIGVTKDGRRAYVALKDKDRVAVADLTNRTVVTEIAVDKSPASLAMSPLQPKSEGVPLPSSLPNTGSPAPASYGSLSLLASAGAILLVLGGTFRMLAVRKPR